MDHRAVGHLGPGKAVAIDLVGDDPEVQQVPVHQHALGAVVDRQADVVDSDDLDGRGRIDHNVLARFTRVAK